MAKDLLKIIEGWKWNLKLKKLRKLRNPITEDSSKEDMFKPQTLGKVLRWKLKPKRK